MPLRHITTGLIVIALVTTAILPGRQTPQVLNAADQMVYKPLATAMGTRTYA